MVCTVYLIIYVQNLHRREMTWKTALGYSEGGYHQTLNHCHPCLFSYHKSRFALPESGRVTD